MARLRTSSSTSAPPATLIVSWRTSNGIDSPREQVVGRVVRVDRLDEQVLDVRVDVRRAPRDPGVVAEDDARARPGTRRRRRRTGRPSLTVRQWRPFMNQTDGIAEPEMRVVGEERACRSRVFDGATTQLFEPTRWSPASPSPPSRPASARIAVADARRGRASAAASASARRAAVAAVPRRRRRAGCPRSRRRRREPLRGRSA